MDKKNDIKEIQEIQEIRKAIINCNEIAADYKTKDADFSKRHIQLSKWLNELLKIKIDNFKKENDDDLLELLKEYKKSLIKSIEENGPIKTEKIFEMVIFILDYLENDIKNKNSIKKLLEGK